MIAVALVLFSLTQESEHGKADARLAGALRTTISLYDDRRDEARPGVRRIAGDDELAARLGGRDRAAIAARLRELVAADPSVAAAAFYSPDGSPLARAGSNRALAFATVVPTTAAGRRLGTLAAAGAQASALAREASRFTGVEVRVMRGDRLLASTIGRTPAPADSGDVEIAGQDYRARAQELEEGVGDPTSIHVLQEADELADAITRSRLLIGGILLAFLFLALSSSVFVVRALQGQVDNFLQAARRLGRGDFGEPVPVHGEDEFAALGQEFNTMAAQLEAHIAEVERKRRELEDSIRRIGEAFGAGLDRQGLVDLAVRTAVESCDAHAGRLLPVDPRDLEEVRVVEDPVLLGAIEAAERKVLGAEDGGSAPARVSLDGTHALAMRLTSGRGGEEAPETIAAVAIARAGEDFTPQQRDLFAYLVAQTEVSIENADLHALVQRQAITDELTGLWNVRHFHDLLDQEIERAQRFNHHIGLVMVDIDDFKQVNDTYGHPQGDLVLKEIARVLQAESRDIDFPARYGGEEMAVILPQTDAGGAAMLAERMREAIERLEVRRLDGQGVLKLTGSFGVAAVPASATDKRHLIAVADEALYRAKRSGKNRVERAETTPEGRPASR